MFGSDSIVKDAHNELIGFSDAAARMDNDVFLSVCRKPEIDSAQEFFDEYCAEHERRFGEPFKHTVTAVRE